MTPRRLNLVLNGKDILVTISGPSRATSVEDDYREVSFVGADHMPYRGVFFKDLRPSGSVCRYDDNQLILVASLDDATIAQALNYIVENGLESEALEVMAMPDSASTSENHENPGLTEAERIEARINQWIRSAISLMRCADIATSRDEIIEELISRGTHIVKLIEDDEASAKGEA